MARTRRRRKVLVDVNNHDRWIVSYADFITLLFAFFVVMYSISSVNEGKYKSLTQSIGTAFSNNALQENTVTPVNSMPKENTGLIMPNTLLTIPFEAMPLGTSNAMPFEETWDITLNPFIEKAPFADIRIPSAFNNSQSNLSAILSVPFEAAKFDFAIPFESEDKQKASSNTVKPDAVQNEPIIQIDESALLKSLNVTFESTNPDAQPEPDGEKRHELSDEILKERQQLKQISDQLENALGSFIKDDLVAIKRNDYWIELEMNSELLFLSGEAALSKKAQPVLKEIAQVINTLPNAINVEGYTDNVPISNLKFASNWELSSSRATSVVQEFVKEGINPTRLSAVGYGEFHPIADNMTEEGRFKNRRVTLVLMSQAFARYGANDAERAKLLNLKPSVENNPPSATLP